MPVWEYKYETFAIRPIATTDEGVRQMQEAESQLKRSGDDGWELASLVPTTVNNTGWYVVIWKRKKR